MRHSVFHIVISVILICLVNSIPALADSDTWNGEIETIITTVYGPETVQAPLLGSIISTTKNDSFLLTQIENIDTFKMIILNGDGQPHTIQNCGLLDVGCILANTNNTLYIDTKRVASAAVTLNSTQVTTASTFTNQQYDYEPTVIPIAGLNLVEMVVKGPVGSTMSVAVQRTRVIDHTPPVIMTNVTDGEFTNKNTVTVNITKNANVSSVVKINGNQVTTSTLKEFSFNLIEGLNQIEIDTTDEYGDNAIPFTANVTYNNIPPTLTYLGSSTIVVPSFPASFNFQVKSSEKATLTVGSDTMTSTDNITYSDNINVAAPGSYTYTVTAVDPEGNTSTLSQTIVVDTPPVITTTLPSGSLTNKKSIQVNVSSPNTISTTVKINGVVATTSTLNQFNFNLVEGNNNIEIDSVDQYGTAATPVIVNNLTLNDIPPTLTYIGTSPIIVSSFPATINFQVKSSEAATLTVGSTPMQTTDNSTYLASLSVSAPASKTYTVTATDAAGNTATLTQTVIVDTIPVISTNLPGGTLTNKKAITVNIAQLASVTSTVLINGSQVATSTQSQFTFNLVEGANQIEIDCVDSFGVSAVPVKASITLDDVAPVLTYTGVKNSYTPTLPATLNLSVSSSKPVTLTVGSDTMKTTDNANYTDSVSVSQIGSQTFTFNAVDAAGNTATITQSVVVDIPPVISTTLPSGSLTNVKTIQVTISSQDTVSSTVTINGNTVATSTQKSFSFNLVEGNNSIQISSVDQYGGTASPIVVNNLVLNDIPPTLSYTGSTTFIAQSLPTTVHLVVSSSEPATILVGNDQMTTTDNATYSKDEQVSQAGSTVFTFTATDAAGNTSTITQSVLVDLPPTISTSLPSGSLTNIKSIEVTVSSSYTVSSTVKINGNSVATSANKQFSFNLLEGNNNIEIDTVDQYGATATLTKNNLVLNDIPPTLAYTGQSNVIVQSLPTTIHFTLTSSEPATILVNNTPMTTTDNMTYSADISVSQVGSSSYAVTATDAAGNVATLNQSILVDVPPVISTTLPSGNLTNLKSISVTINSQSNVTSTVSINGNVVTSSTQKTFNFNLVEGNNNIEVDCVDQYGANATSVIKNNLVLNDVPPKLTYTGQTTFYAQSLPTSVTLQVTSSEPVTALQGSNPMATTDNANYTEVISISQAGSSSYTFTATDAAGNTSTISQAILVDLLPTISTSLPSGSLTNVKLINVTIASSNTVSTTVKINGNVVATSTQKTFSFNLVEGNNNIEIDTVDQSGGTATLIKNNLVLNDIPPTLNYTGTQAYIFNSFPGSFTFQVSSSEPATLTLGSDTMQTTDNVNYTDVINVSQVGPVTYTVNAVDSAGNTSSLSQQVFIDTAPTIITTLPSAQLTNKKSIQVTITSPTTTTSTVKINGNTVTTSTQSQFSFNLLEGNNNVEVDCVDQYGAYASSVIVNNLVLDDIAPVLTYTGSPTIFTKVLPTSFNLLITSSEPANILANSDVMTSLGNNQYSDTVTATTSGNIIYHFQATDVAGNTGLLDQTINVDILPVLASNLQNGQLTNNKIAQVTVTSANTVTSTVKINGNTVATSTQNQFNFNLVEGVNNIEVDAVDQLGGAATPLIISNVTLDDVAPVLTYTGNSLITVPQFPATIPITITSSKTANVNLNGTAMTSVGNNQFTGNITVTQEGPVSFIVQATDLAGNTTTLNQSITIDMPLSVTANIQTNESTNQTLVQVTVNSQNSTTATVKDNGTVVTTSTQKSFTFNLLEGNNNVEIDCVDQYGEVATPFIANSVAVDNMGAVLTYTGNTTIYTNQLPMTFTFTVRSSKDANLTLGSDTMISVGMDNYSDLITINNPGINTYTVQAVDSFGNVTTLSQDIDVEVSSAVPVLTVNLPDRSLTNQGNISLSVQVQDPIPTMTLITLNGSQVEQTADTNINTNLTLTNGDNTIQITALDSAGNTSGTITKIVTFDNTPPQLLSSSPANGSTVRSAQFTISGTSNKVLASATINGTAATLSDDAKSFTLPYTTSSMGSLTLNYVLTDLAGNITQANSTISIDSTLLVPSLVAAMPNPDGAHINIVGSTGAALAGANVSVSTGVFGSSASGTVNSDGSFILLLSKFATATLTVTSGSNSAQMTINFNGTTTLSGIVSDTNGVPLVGATLSIQGTTNSVVTDSNGNFSFSGLNSGVQTLVVDGTTITQASAGPNRSFSISNIVVNIGLGQQNVMPRAIYLSPVRLDGTQTVVNSGSSAVATSPDDSNIALAIPSGAATFPDGTQSGNISINVVGSQYSTIPVPMSAVPDTVVTLEPSGLSFNQRVKLTLTNTNQLPEGVQFTIFSMNSTKGRWEVDGLAQVDPGGQTLSTLEGQGISHFSTVYAVPISPTVTPIGNPNLLGVNVSDQSIGTSVSLPSYKSLGQDISFGLKYKSAWAHPTAVVSNMFDIPTTQTTLTQTGQNETDSYDQVSYQYCFAGTFCQTKYQNYYLQYINTENVTSTSWYVPQSISSQFFVGTIASNQTTVNGQAYPGSGYSVVSQNPTDLPGVAFVNGIVTPAVQYQGLPNQSYMTYGVDLKDPTSGSFLQSGIYPTIARYQVTLSHMTLTSGTIVSSVLANGNLVNQVVNYEQSLESNLINSVSPQDVHQSIIVQNKSNSSAGSGWHLTAAQKIINPASSIIALEESSGDLSTYSVNQQINTIYDGTITGALDLTQAADLSNWPNALGVTYDSSANSILSKVDISATSPSPTSVGTINTFSGTLEVADISACSNSSANLNESLVSYKDHTSLTGFSYDTSGNIYFTDSRESAIGRMSNGVYTRLAGEVTTSQLPALVYQTTSQLTSSCQSMTGNSCSTPGSFTAYPCTDYRCVVTRGPSGSKTTCLFQAPNNSTGVEGVAGFSNGNTGDLGVNPTNIGLSAPSSMLTLADGTVLVADHGNNIIRRINLASNTISSFAGNQTNVDSGDGGAALSAGINLPNGLAQDSSGNIYISTTSGYIRKIDTNGNISTIAGLPLGSGGSLTNEAPMVTMFLNNPTYLLMDNTNNYLYVSDSGNNRVLRMDLNAGLATTVAGNGQCITPIGDGGPAVSASICSPSNLGFDNNQNLLILDSGNKKIRRVNFNTVSGGSLAYAPSANDLSTLTKNSDGSFTRTYRNGSVVQFNSLGLEVSATDRLNNQTAFTYDNNNNLLSVTDATGQVTNFNYSSNMLTSIQDPAGRMTQMTYNGNLLTSVIFPDGTRRSYQYDSNNLLVQETDQNSNSTNYAYNSFSRVSSIQYPDNSVVQINDYASSVASTEYTANQATFASPGVEQGQANSSVVSGNQTTTTYSADLNGYTTNILDPLGRTTTIERDINGNPIMITYADGTHETLAYDPNTNDLLSTTQVEAGITRSKTYNSFGQALTSTDGNGRVTTYNYGSNTGLVSSVISPGGITKSYTYNNYGEVVTETIYPSANQSMTVQNIYDSKGNLTETIAPDGKTSFYSYDQAGNVIQATTGSGSAQAITQYKYDQLNRLSKVISAKGEVTTYTYTNTGKISTIADATGKTRTYRYDTRDRLIQWIEPDSTTTSYTYDNNGNLVTQTDANGNVASFGYNAVNKIQYAQYPDDAIGFSYDLRDRIISESNGTGTVIFQRDSVGNVKVAQFTGNRIGNYPTIPFMYTYDNEGRKLSVSSGTYGVVYGFNSLNQLTQISNSAGDTFNYSYDSSNRMVALSRPGSTTSYSYNGAGLISMINSLSSSGSLNYFQYSYDTKNEPTQNTTITGSYGYTYDADGQLIATTLPNSQVESFVYDTIGNRTQDQGGSYTYDNTDQRLVSDYNYTYKYDKAGNLINKFAQPSNTNQNSYIYSYNSKNQLIQVQVTNGPTGSLVSTTNYTYDVLGRRIQKIVTNAQNASKSFARQYVYDGNNMAFEYDGSANLLATHTYSPSHPDDILASSITTAGSNAGLAPNSGSIYYLKDNIGSITDVVSASNNTVIQRYIYSGFGKVVKITDGSGADITTTPLVRTSYTFASREYENETGLYYNRARYYDPSNGRFLQKDSDSGHLSDPTTFVNKYSYTANRPTYETDPTGMFSFGEAIGYLVAVVFPIPSFIALNTTSLFQSVFGFNQNDKNLVNTVDITAAIIGAAILTGGAAADYFGAEGLSGAAIGGGAGAVTGAGIGAVSFPATGLGNSQQGLLYGLLIGSVGGAASGYGLDELYADGENYVLHQWSLATQDTLGYFLDLGYQADDSAAAGFLGGGFAGPALGASAIYGGIKIITGQPITR